MSNLHKFHRRTQSVGPATWPAMAIGMGDNAHGYWLGGASYNKLIVSPKLSEDGRAWGSYGTTRNATNSSDGLSNTNILAGFGEAAHPAAYYCKNLTTGGYNTWYLPAKDELNTMYNNRNAIPFATENGFHDSYRYWSSTESDGKNAWSQNLWDGNQSLWNYGGYKGYSFYRVRAVRRSPI